MPKETRTVRDVYRQNDIYAKTEGKRIRVTVVEKSKRLKVVDESLLEELDEDLEYLPEIFDYETRIVNDEACDAIYTAALERYRVKLTGNPEIIFPKKKILATGEIINDCHNGRYGRDMLLLKQIQMQPYTGYNSVGRSGDYVIPLGDPEKIWDFRAYRNTSRYATSAFIYAPATQPDENLFPDPEDNDMLAAAGLQVTLSHVGKIFDAISCAKLTGLESRLTKERIKVEDVINLYEAIQKVKKPEK